MKRLVLVLSLAFPSCVGPDGADPTDKVLVSCPENFGGPSVVKCFKNDCNWCVVKSTSGWTECTALACGGTKP